nr:glycosyltransferase family 39 protein [Bacteroidota bacterium]
MKKATVSAKSVTKSKATAPQRNKPSIPKGISWHWWLGLAIVVVSTFVAYSTCLDNDFTNWDDPGYIIENPIIKTMSGENIKRIFTEPYFANYQPLHIFSYMIEYHFFGLDASGYHWVSVIMHIINTLLVAFIALLLLKDRYIAIAVSLLFGVHSIHVESVAWAAERKDLLYTMFFFASFIFYILYVQKSQTKWLIVSVVFFVFSIFSKAMAVSLVPVLFLIDVLYSRKLSVKLFLEKIPYLILALILGIVWLKVTKPEDAFTPTGDTYTLVERLFFASHNLLQYFAKSVFSIRSKWVLPISHCGQSNIACAILYRTNNCTCFFGFDNLFLAQNPLDCSAGRIFYRHYFPHINAVYHRPYYIFGTIYIYIVFGGLFIYRTGCSIFCFG